MRFQQIDSISIDWRGIQYLFIFLLIFFNSHLQCDDPDLHTIHGLTAQP